MDSEAYWKQRAEEREKYWHKICQETIEAQLADYYQASLSRIQTDIAALYGRFAVDNELSIAEAYKLLTGKEFRQWRMSMEAYLKQIQDSGDKGLERELNTLAMRSRISRLDKLYSETLQELDRLGRKTSKDMTDFLTEAYKDNYYRGTYDIAKAGELKNAVSKVDSKALEDVLRTRWSGKNYSERIWKNQKLLAKTIKDEMLTAVHRGESVEKISKRIATRMNVGISNARRLVRTEMNYVHNQAALDSIHDAGMKYFRFIATLDRRTSAICRAHDGHVYPVSEAASGTNVPPLHPNCRSTIAGSLYGPGKAKTGTRAARNQQTGKTVYVPANMQYEDWKTVYVDKTKTLEEWQEDKRNAIIKTKIESSLKKIGIKFQKLHYPPKEINLHTISFDDNHINHERNHGVTKETAISLIEKAVISITRYNGRNEIYGSSLGWVYILDGYIKTVFQSSEFDSKAKSLAEDLKNNESDVSSY
ncbi:minor capsid protein [uncultured Megasphaera sp.]|uniref:minor capsid protein n=1 Tax=uncultured Megasphaera sp. TaxID=165188 RepID=UPI002659361B|nr:minor capsid protein [uncultured Megasphaera sp.]